MARLLASLCLLLAACNAAPESADAPAPDGRIRDFAEILDPAVEARLAARLDEAGRLYGPQVGIVTVASLDGQTIGDYTTDYANAWGLGDADRDDGLILLVAPNDRQARIGTGLGIQRTYPDDWALEVLTAMTPQFREGNYERGIEGTVDMIVARMKLFPTLPAPTLPANDNAPVETREAA